MTDTDPRALFLAAVDLVDEQANTLPDEAWLKPSACAGWDARDVLVHVTGSLGKVNEMLSGGAYAAVPASVDAKPEPAAAIAAWREAARQAKAGVQKADLDSVAQSALGARPLAQALALPTADCAIHAWDIAVADGGSVELPPELMELVRAVVAQAPAEVRATVFAPPVEAPTGAGPTDALAAELGRTRP